MTLLLIKEVLKAVHKPWKTSALIPFFLLKFCPFQYRLDALYYNCVLLDPFVVQSLSHVQLFAACQAPLSFAVPWSLLKFMSIESVMLSNHLIWLILFRIFYSKILDKISIYLKAVIIYKPLLQSWAFKVVSQPAIGILARWSCSGRGCTMPLKMSSSTLGFHLLDATAPRLPGAANQKCLQMPRVPWGQTVPVEDCCLERGWRESR